MATTYDYIAANKRRSVILIVAFVVVVLLIGWVFMELLDYGLIGLFFAIVIAVAMALIGYYQGDRIALSTAGAKGPITKDDNPYLYRLVENLCLASGLPLPKIYLIPDRQINAFATGRDPRRAAIAVTTGAIEQLANEELEGVLAHELSHIKNYDMRYMMLVAVLVGIIALLSNYFWRASFLGGRRRNSGGGQIQLIILVIGLVLLIIAPILARFMQFAVSRKREFLADASATLLTRYPEGLARALEKIAATTDAPLEHANNATAHLYISNPYGLKLNGLSKLFSTHPPIAERIQALRQMGGRFNEL